MENILFVTAQPDVPYFHWQVKLYTNNFIEKWIKPCQIHVIFGLQKNKLEKIRWSNETEMNKKTNVIFQLNWFFLNTCLKVYFRTITILSFCCVGVSILGIRIRILKSEYGSRDEKLMQIRMQGKKLMQIRLQRPKWMRIRIQAKKWMQIRIQGQKLMQFRIQRQNIWIKNTDL